MGDIISQLAPSKPLPQMDGYLEILKRIQFWRDSYEAGPDYSYGVDARGDEILWRYSDEEYADLLRRKQRVIVEPEVRPAVDKYVSFAMRQNPTRVHGIQWYEEFIRDADGSGNNLDMVLDDLLRWSIVDQFGFLMVFTNAESSRIPATTGVRSFVQQIDRAQVPWFIAKRGQVEQAIVILSPSEAVYYTAEFWIGLGIKSSRGANTQFTITDVRPPVPNIFKKVPLVLFEPKLKMVMDLSEFQKQILNLQSLSNQNTFNTVFNQMVFTGVSEPEGNTQGAGQQQDGTVRVSTRSVIFTPGDAKYIAPSSAVLEMISKRIDQFREQIRSITGLGITDPNQVESGLAKRFRFDELNTRIVNILNALENAERRVTELAALGAGTTPPPPVRYPDDVSVPDILEEYTRTKDILDDDSIPNTLKISEVEQLASLYDLSEEQQSRLRREIAALYQDPEAGQEAQQAIMGEEDDASRIRPIGSDEIREDLPSGIHTLEADENNPAANHEHEVILDGSVGEFRSNENPEGQNVEPHRHIVTVNDDGSIEVQSVLGHTHEVMVIE